MFTQKHGRYFYPSILRHQNGFLKRACFATETCFFVRVLSLSMFMCHNIQVQFYLGTNPLLVIVSDMTHLLSKYSKHSFGTFSCCVPSYNVVDLFSMRHLISFTIINSRVDTRWFLWSCLQQRHLLLMFLTLLFSWSLLYNLIKLW